MRDLRGLSGCSRRRAGLGVWLAHTVLICAVVIGGFGPVQGAGARQDTQLYGGAELGSARLPEHVVITDGTVESNRGLVGCRIPQLLRGHVAGLWSPLLRISADYSGIAALFGQDWAGFVGSLIEKEKSSTM